MDDHKALLQAQQRIKLPVKAKDDSGWVVKHLENEVWKDQKFKLQEDAWNFFYSKLSELKTTLMKTGLTRQKGV